MANQNNPTGNKGLSVNLLPKFYQTSANKKFLQSTIDQLFQPGTVTKTNGFVGRKNAKAATGADVYVSADTITRQNYQLEPGLVINDALGNVTFFKDYIDYINQIGVLGGNTSQHERLNKQEFYSWDPHINWDKIVNFQNYYWLPYGPDTIKIYGQQIESTSTYQVKLENEGNANQYVFTPDGLTRSPMLKLYRGQTYTFNINSPSNPFSFKTERSAGTAHRYVISGISAYGVEVGTITFTVPPDAPSILFYQSEADVTVGGAIAVFDSNELSSIDVENEILGKQSYTLTDGTALSNGMKLSFAGQVTPAKYASGQYYVEGVGTAIKLVPETDLYVTSPYTTDVSIEFDTVPFDSEPFSDASGYAGKIDYITINRASQDRNQWSRYNRWFHQDVITVSAAHNGNTPSLDQNARAKRPIIEFEANLQLFNMGTNSVSDIDLVDNFTKDIFSIIEGSRGYNIDGIDIHDGQRILFTADTDPLVTNKIYTVSVVNIRGYDQIHLTADADPVRGESVLITAGKKNQGLVYWYDGAAWHLGQQKLNVNQPPLFDVVDETGVSFSDNSVYNGSTFQGTPIFSYKTGTSTADSVLGFSLSYQNVSNIGDIVFNFNLTNDEFQYKKNNVVVTQGIGVGYLKSYDYAGNVSYVNGWQQSDVMYIQFAVQIYKNSGLVNKFDISMFDNISTLQLDSDDVRVYINDVRVNTSEWSLVAGSKYYAVVFKTDLKTSDVVTIKVHASQTINDNGFYEIPINLQNNPLNDSPTNFTLGEIINHVDSIIDNIYEFNANGVATTMDSIRSGIPSGTFVGVFPGTSNLHDLGNVTKYGTKFVQHSGPLSISEYHIASEENNLIKAIKSSRDDYADFKRNFIATASTLGKDSTPEVMVDIILTKLFGNTPSTAPYYFTDMVPFGAKIVTDLTVVDYRIKNYPLSQAFSLDTLSHKAVGIYLNGVQLVHGRDYTFDGQGAFTVTATMANGDILSTYEYDSTDGSFVPATPTKLGMWPKYEPKIYLDTSLVTPQLMIQGHDGSLILAYGDYRDHVILELEKRIYNNLKVAYDASIFDIHSVIPGYNRTTDYTLTEMNAIMAPHFYSWSKLIGMDYTKSLNFDRSNPFTFNYTNNSAPNGTNLPGYWRGVYRWLLDTDRPHLCPWEMLGFSIEPTWWTKVYGPAPYTSDNLILWQDLSNGLVKEPGKPAKVLTQYIRPFLADNIPVDESGNLMSPIESGLAKGVITQSIENNFVFGDMGPVETAWRRSSHYAFSSLITFILMNPASTIGTLIDRSRVVRNLAGQLIYSDTGLRLRPSDILIPSIYTSPDRIQTAGLVNYVVDYLMHYIFSNNASTYAAYKSNMSNIGIQLSYRVGAFTNKAQFNLLLESKTPSSTGSVFIPAEDYSIFLNTSSSIKRLDYSGIMITRLSTGYEVRGYSNSHPYFHVYDYNREGIPTNIGGISSSYAVWTPGQHYVTGSIVKYGNNFYRASVAGSAESFNLANFTPLASLPITGGITVMMRNGWDRTTPTTVPYGTLFDTPQEVVDFILGYGEYLKDQGFVFDEYNTSLGMVANWETSAKEFLFWTTQNWTVGQEKWTDWIPNQPISYGTIVRYDGDYYSALFNILPEPTFDFDKYNKLEGLSTVGSSVISLSPGANGVSFKASNAVVDDIGNTFNDYEIFKVDGTPIPLSNLSSEREGDVITYKPITTEGIYNASFYLIQHEHVILINNTTIFNDVIYNPESGYRRERIKVSGYVTINWDGSLNIPGFIFDQASIQNWQQWQDYNMGDVIKHQSHYYSANKFITGSATFVSAEWTQLASKPVPAILPNWTNIATQFNDFYSLDVDSFDVNQQAVAQHLIGYQKRQYLNNIIQDEVSEFKFYQGMIREKGTQNVLNKLFGVLESDNLESLIFYEEWALRVGQYGAKAAFENIEFVLDEGKFKSNPQGISLSRAVDNTLSPFIIQQTPNDVYLKPLGYDSKPFPENKNGSTYLRPAGYVNAKDVSVSIGSVDQLVSYDITKLTHGAYIWCAFEGPSWNVYRYTYSGSNVLAVTYDSGVLTITTDSIIPLTVGSVVGLMEVPLLNGFYKVTSVVHNVFTIEKTLDGFQSPFADAAKLVVYTLISQHFDNIDTIDTSLTTEIDNGSLIWTDDGGNGKWAVWEYEAVYGKVIVADSDPVGNLGYGDSLGMSANSTILGIGASDGTVTIHDKVGISVPWVQRQLVQKPFIAYTPVINNHVASVIAFSADGTWMATGSPFASSAVTQYVGAHVPGTRYAVGKIVSTSTNGHIVAYYKAMVSTTQTPSNTASDWKVMSYVPIESLGSPSTIVNQGVVSIYSKDANNIYSLVDTIVGPNPATFTGEKFGSNLVFGDNVLYIGAPGSGSIYKLNYKTTVRVSTGYNPLGSSNANIKVTSNAGVRVGMFVTCVTSPNAFVSGQYVIGVSGTNIVHLSGSPDATPSGQLNFSSISWEYDLANVLAPSGYTVGKTFALSADGSVLSVAGSASVSVYDVTAESYDLNTTITGTGAFGASMSLSSNGSYLAISNPESNTYGTSAGLVTVYEKTNAGYVKTQDLVTRLPSNGSRFGSKISFMNDYKTIVVLSQDSDSIATVPSVFDSTTTTFDNKLTRFVETQVSSGRIDIYDRYSTKWVFSESLDNTSVVGDGYGTGFAVGDNSVSVSAPSAYDGDVQSGLVYNHIKRFNKYSWSVRHTQGGVVDISKVKQAFLYNKDRGTMVKHLDVIDPLQGKIAGIAEEELSLKTYYDPAVYAVGTGSVNVSDSSFWSKAHVGKLWWDLRTAKFLETAFDDIEYRTNNWNTLAPGASIDVYEWVESKVKPSVWDSRADTPAGLAAGISGTSLYGDASYSITQRYDNISKTFYDTYYFWVKNKRIVPSVPGRHLTAQEVAALIANPRGQGYTFLALTGLNSIGLVNAAPYLEDQSVVCSIEYWLIDKTDLNVHSQWKLISNDTIVDLPKTIEQKWIDSLCGIDQAGRAVPDMTLPPKLRYGVENRPRQSMFVNRVEALKQMIERINRVLVNVQVTDLYDISDLSLYDKNPSISSQTGSLYDLVVDTYEDLPIISGYTRPSITPIIVDGRIVDVKVNSTGSGYLAPPTVSISGTGEGAVVQYTSTTHVEVANGGEGYDNNTQLHVRDYSVLVMSDSQANGNWSIYSYDPDNQVWSRILTQSYDVRNYWQYVDWFATGYNQFSAADYAVSTFVDLNSITPDIGNLVKVNQANASGWLLLKRTSATTSTDWTQGYEVVGIQNGTIQFKSSLYEFSNTDVGYDASTFDGSSFDVVASTELRIILNTVKDKLFIGELKQEYLNLFIAAIHYAHSEQMIVDWAFKTSFVRATHKVGQLSQPVNYPVNNLPNFQDYIDEVKPYRTKIREYISNYSGVPQTDGVDWNYSAVSDFDLPPSYEDGKVTAISTHIVDGKIQVDDPAIQTDPQKQWYQNVGFEVTELKIVDGGMGYSYPPRVEISGTSGSGATAQAFLTNGKVSRLILLTPGSGYLSAPKVQFVGGLGVNGTRAAKASAIIGGGVVRSSLVAMKFDRISSTYLITDLSVSQTFKTPYHTQILQWAPDITIGKSSVTVDGVPLLRELYTLSVVSNKVNGATQYSGKLVIDSSVTISKSVSINYVKDVALLAATDRIQYHYNPIAGSLGKDLSQLMTGIDYGGVQVSGLGFNLSSGWEEMPYATDAWDVYDHTYTDYTVEVQPNTHAFTLPYVPAQDIELNVYYSKTVQSSYVSDNATLEYSYSTSVKNPVVTIENTVQTLNGITVKSGMAIIQRTAVLSVTDTSNLRVGDVVSASGSAIVYGNKVKSIDSATQVTLEQVLFDNITVGTDIVFTRTVKVPDVIMTKVGLMTFAEPVSAGSVIKITGMMDPERLDDPDYGTPSQTNANAIMVTPIGNGSSSIVTIPNTFTVNGGDVFTIRQSTSDGSILPQSSQYDTDISGGNLAYSTATGIAADDIVLDGDDFVSETNSSAPEEVLPGQVIDTVAIKVFDQVSTGAANIKVDSYVADGVKVRYKVTQIPNNRTAIIVKLDQTVMTQGIDYTFDYDSQYVKFISKPAKDSQVSIFSIGFSGSNVLDIDYFVGDGETHEFITKAPWMTEFNALVYIGGLPTQPTFFKTDASYEMSGVVGLRFDLPPGEGVLVNFIIVAGKQQTYAVTKTERITGNGGSVYTLQYPVGNSLPNETNMLVRVGQQVLEAPNNSYYTIKDNNLNYTLEPTKFIPGTVDVTNIQVIANGIPLKQGVEYVADLSGITISINKKTYKKYAGKQLIISVTSNDGYSYNPLTSEITFAQSYDDTVDIEVMSSYVHDVMDIQRTSINVTSSYELTPGTVEYYKYHAVLGGEIQLDRKVLSDEYVWIVKNGSLLTPGLDYSLKADFQSVQLTQPVDVNDAISFITFGSNILTGNNVSYMQFKDMTNRVSYIRLSKSKQTKLAQDLKWNDTSITLVDASNFSVPNPALNRPGVIEIRGERIEYFAKNGNVLSRLRRGTLGTGVCNLNLAGALVQFIGDTEVIPYKDTLVTKQIVSDGTTTVKLPFVPASANDIEVFVGGYDTSAAWAANTTYEPGDFVNIGAYTYKCVTSHTSSTVFNTDLANWQFFIGNIRLKKSEYSVFNVNVAPYSPAGDVTFPADFTVDGANPHVTLTNPVPVGTRITVVKKTGEAWDGDKNNPVNILNDTGKVANFVKAEAGIWYSEYK